MENQNLRCSVGEFVATTNQILEAAYPFVDVEGEVASFAINQGKFVFFELKDESASVGCFMMAFQLRMPIEDGMKVVVRAVPKLTKWGKFSLTVQQVRPVGTGSLKKSFELLKARLGKEGLFAPERKRALPAIPGKIAVIASTQSAGYADFIKIINDRWGGVMIETAHVQVQGEGAADQIVRALEYINQQQEPADVVVMIRGGGSADDLSVFHDEALVRAIAASRVPVLTGIGHETDESLADLAADVVAATPSNAAQLVVPDRRSTQAQVQTAIMRIGDRADNVIERLDARVTHAIAVAAQLIDARHGAIENRLIQAQSLLAVLDPRAVLERGYAIMRGVPERGEAIDIETKRHNIQAEVTYVKAK